MSKSNRLLYKNNYEVERIEDKRIKNKQNEYLVKWVGFPEDQNTWEPLDNLISIRSTLAEFEQSYIPQTPDSSNTKKRGRPLKSQNFLDQFQIEKLLDKRQGLEESEFLVKWKGFIKRYSTWETETHIKTQLNGASFIEEFFLPPLKKKISKTYEKKKGNKNSILSKKTSNDDIGESKNSQEEQQSKDNSEEQKNQESNNQQIEQKLAKENTNEQIEQQQADKENANEQYQQNIQKNNNEQIEQFINTNEQIEQYINNRNNEENQQKQNYEEQVKKTDKIEEEEINKKDKMEETKKNDQIMEEEEKLPEKLDFNNNQNNNEQLQKNNQQNKSYDNDKNLQAAVNEIFNQSNQDDDDYQQEEDEYYSPYSEEDLLELNQFGGYEKTDRPEKILSASPYMDGFLFKVQWKVRKNGERPEPSYISDRLFLERNCSFLTNKNLKNNNIEPVALLNSMEK